MNKYWIRCDNHTVATIETVEPLKDWEMERARHDYAKSIGHQSIKGISIARVQCQQDMPIWKLRQHG